MADTDKKAEIKTFCAHWYNATSTDDGHGEIESYEWWLEKQVFHKHQTMSDQSLQIISLQDQLKLEKAKVEGLSNACLSAMTKLGINKDHARKKIIELTSITLQEE